MSSTYRLGYKWGDYRVLVKKSALLEVGGFREGMKTAQDWELWLRISERYGIGYVHHPLVKYRRHYGNNTNTLHKMLENEKEIIAQIGLNKIEKAIFRRKLPVEKNLSDFVTTLNKLGKWEEGYERICLLSSTDHPSVYFLKGLYCLRKNLIREARECFEMTILLDPNNGAAMNNLAISAAILGEYSRAVNMLEQVLQTRPNYIDANYNKKIVKERQGAFTLEDFQITWRELRASLIQYKMI